MIETTGNTTTGNTMPTRRFKTWFGVGRCPKHPDRRHLAAVEVQGPFIEPPTMVGGYDGPVLWCDCGGQP